MLKPFDWFTPFALAVALFIGGTGPAPAVSRNLGLISMDSDKVCKYSTVQKNIAFASAQPGHKITKITIIQDPKVIGPFIDRELQAGRLMASVPPIDAIYVINFSLPEEFVVVAISYKGCYLGSITLPVSPFVTS